MVIASQNRTAHDGHFAAVGRPDVAGFHDPATGAVQYVVSDPKTRSCAIIDPVLDFQPATGTLGTASADRLLAHIAAHGLTPEWILDTHPHADHLTAAAYLRDVTGARTVTGERVVEVQTLWKARYNLPDSCRTDGSQWDVLLADGARLPIGSLQGRVMLSPGHTLCSITCHVGDAAFVHDTLFMPDTGTARADFPGADARRLWRSIQWILQLPGETRLFTGHDYQVGGRDAVWESTVARQKVENPHVVGVEEDGFVSLRTARDRTLPPPRLMLAAMQVNIACGRPPPPEGNGVSYLRMPLGAFPGRAGG